ncbi:MAG: FG-GAP repeat protein [Sedimentisphaerales bacterium]|nr:FG-GAP repeat protein [Sedimentisphaerales bacterium]
MEREGCILCIVMAGAAVLGLGARLQGAQEIAKLAARNQEAGDGFGYALAVSGDYALVGAPGEDSMSDDAGAAYVFRFNGTTWVQQAKLMAADGGWGHYFGASVAIHGDCAVVGAVGGRNPDTLNTGAAYVFYRSGANWVQQAKLNASDAANCASFGCAVATDGNVIVVGSWGDDARGYDAGAAYVFRRAGASWTQQQKLTASDGAADDCFGVSIALDGNCLLIGASGDNDYGNDSGSAYVFYDDGGFWVQQQKLTVADGTANQFFGESVALGGSHAIIGASGDAQVGLFSGSAYAFVRDGATWTATSKLMSSDLGPGDSFGNGVALCSSYALITAPGEDAVYAFTWDGSGWVEQSKLCDPAGEDNDVFGASVATDSDHVLVGAPGDDDDRGSAYVYDGTSLRLAPVHRFWSEVYGNHFYTISQYEKDYVMARWSDVWIYEGISYYTFPENAVAGLSAVHRFWSERYCSHFYTADEAEKEYVIDMYPGIWVYEGPVFYAFRPGQQPAGTVPVYRFWSEDLAAHFYTASLTDRDFLLSHPERGWQYETIAWYAYP